MCYSPHRSRFAARITLWARTGSNRRPLVCKSEPDGPPRFTRCHSVFKGAGQRLVRVHCVRGVSGSFCPSWHTLGTTGVFSSGVRLHGGLAFSLPWVTGYPRSNGFRYIDEQSRTAQKMTGLLYRLLYGRAAASALKQALCFVLSARRAGQWPETGGACAGPARPGFPGLS